MARPVLRSVLALSTIAVVNIACSAHRSDPARTPQKSSPHQGAHPSSPREILDRQEILSSTARDAYEAIARHRPEFLRNRRAEFNDPNGLSPTHPQASASGELSEGYPTVYLNGVRHGGPPTLRNISTTVIVQIRYFREPTMPMFYGVTNPGGVLEVTIKP